MMPQDIEACYRDIAADQAREREALEWSEAVIADSCQVLALQPQSQLRSSSV